MGIYNCILFYKVHISMLGKILPYIAAFFLIVSMVAIAQFILDNKPITQSGWQKSECNQAALDFMVSNNKIPDADMNGSFCANYQNEGENKKFAFVSAPSNSHNNWRCATVAKTEKGMYMSMLSKGSSPKAACESCFYNADHE